MGWWGRFRWSPQRIPGRSPRKRTLTPGRYGSVVSSRHLAGCGLRAVKYSCCFCALFPGLLPEEPSGHNQFMIIFRFLVSSLVIVTARSPRYLVEFSLLFFGGPLFVRVDLRRLHFIPCTESSQWVALETGRFSFSDRLLARVKLILFCRLYPVESFLVPLP